MSPDALQQDFGLIADLVHGYALERPHHPALIHDARVLTYGELDQLMDRVAASLQRDGVQSGDVISICAASCVEYGAIFLGALRAGVAVAPLAPSSTPEALATMLADCGAKILFLDEPIAAALEGQKLPAALRLRADIDARLARAGGCAAAAGADRSRRAVQHHLFVGHDRHAEGNRAIAPHALGARPSRGAGALRPHGRDDLLDAAVFEHDAGELLSDAGDAAAPSC